MKSVLAGFLGTYTSRYSDLRGYWLHGQVPFHNVDLDVDLLATPPSENTLGNSVTDYDLNYRNQACG
jgi:hypothetical protein